MRLLTAGCCLLLTVAVAHAAPRPPRPMTVDDQFRLVDFGDPLLSPDGRWVLYTATRTALAENARHATTWLAAVDGKVASRPFLRDGDGSPMWAPGSASVFFVRTGQLFEQRLDATEPVQRSRLPGNAPWLWQLARDGSFLLAVASDPVPGAPGGATDTTFVDEGANAQRRFSWDNVYRYDLRNETLTRLTDRAWSIAAADLAPDGRRAVVAARPDNGRNTRWKTELFSVDLATGEVRQLTHNAAPEETPRWSPDGTWILFNAVALDRWELGNGDFWRLDVATGQTRLLTPGRVGRFGGEPVFAPDGRTVFTGSGYATARFPVRIDVGTGVVEPLVQTEGAVRVGSWSADRQRFAYLHSDATNPPEVYVGRTGDPRDRQQRLTDSNAWVAEEIAMGPIERVVWTSADGLRIEGLLQLPAGVAERPLPLLVHVPCGPGCGSVNSFSARNQVYAGRGWAQLQPNVRGSSNYDDAFMRANLYDIGVGDRDDVLAGVDALIVRGVADADKLAIGGWSYGAVLAGQILTKTGRFRAASLGAMVSDWVADYGSVVYYTNERWFIGGTPWSHPERWRERSSIHFADRVTTPTLLHHGDDDTACAPFQSMNFFVALRRFGRTARLIRYPGEGHDLQQPAHVRLRDQQNLAWMQWFARGIREPDIPDGPSTLAPVLDQPPPAAPFAESPRP